MSVVVLLRNYIYLVGMCFSAMKKGTVTDDKYTSCKFGPALQITANLLVHINQQ